MFDLDSWQEIFSSLARNPLRTFLTAFGVFWGIFMLIVMMGAGNGLADGSQRGFSGRATNSVFIWTRRTTKPYKGFKPGRYFNMNLEDYKALKANLNNARIISPRNQLGGYRGSNLVVRGNKNGTFNIYGDYPQVIQVEAIELTRGRFINHFDISDTRKVAVIGERVRELLYQPEEEVLGTYIRINGVYFQVVGEFKSKAEGERAIEETQRVYVPFTTFSRAFNFGNRVGWLTITSENNVPVEKVANEAMDILKSRHQVAPDDERAFGNWNMQKEFQKIQNVMLGINFLSWFVGFFTLLAGAIGISNIMLVVVRERTKEIGIRRALGARPWMIVSQIILEAVTLTVFAGYFGMLLGIGLVEGAAWAIESFDLDLGFFGIPSVDFRLILRALAILVGAGVLAGLIPARRAINVSPVDALRTE